MLLKMPVMNEPLLWIVVTQNLKGGVWSRNGLGGLQSFLSIQSSIWRAHTEGEAEAQAPGQVGHHLTFAVEQEISHAKSCD